MSEKETLENPQDNVVQETEPKFENFLNFKFDIPVEKRPDWMPLEAWYAIFIGFICLIILFLLYILRRFYRKTIKKNPADKILEVMSKAIKE